MFPELWFVVALHILHMHFIYLFLLVFTFVLSPGDVL